MKPLGYLLPCLLLAIVGCGAAWVCISDRADSFGTGTASRQEGNARSRGRQVEAISGTRAIQ